MYDRTDGGFDRSYLYDLVGRLVDARTSSAAYYQSYSYDEFNHMTSRGNGSWRHFDTTVSQYRDNRNTSTTVYPPAYPSCCPPQPVVWSYDAAGNVRRDHNKEYTFDAAGNKVRVLETTEVGISLTKKLWIYQDYDADGQRVRRVVQTQHYSGSYSFGTSYYVRSSVLGDKVITELNENGAKRHTYVYANGTVLAQQKAGQVTWLHTDPVTNSLSVTLANGAMTSRMEFDPLGDEVPGSDPQPTYEYTGDYGDGGNPYDGASGCTMDGLPTPCSLVVRLVNTGVAAQCPRNQCGPRFNGGEWEFLRFTDEGLDYEGGGWTPGYGVVDARTGAGWYQRRRQDRRPKSKKQKPPTTVFLIPMRTWHTKGNDEWQIPVQPPDPDCDKKLAEMFGGKDAIAAGSGYEPRGMPPPHGNGEGDPRWRPHVYRTLHLYYNNKGTRGAEPIGLYAPAGGGYLTTDM